MYMDIPTYIKKKSHTNTHTHTARAYVCVFSTSWQPYKAARYHHR